MLMHVFVFFYIIFKKKRPESIRAVVSLGTGKAALKEASSYEARWPKSYFNPYDYVTSYKGVRKCFNILKEQVNI